MQPLGVWGFQWQEIIYEKTRSFTKLYYKERKPYRNLDSTQDPQTLYDRRILLSFLQFYGNSEKTSILASKPSLKVIAIVKRELHLQSPSRLTSCDSPLLKPLAALTRVVESYISSVIGL
ncbi:hypothetical protein AVEN_118703-1, partial [Araneus ventricosus]